MDVLAVNLPNSWGLLTPTPFFVTVVDVQEGRAVLQFPHGLLTCQRDCPLTKGQRLLVQPLPGGEGTILLRILNGDQGVSELEQPSLWELLGEPQPAQAEEILQGLLQHGLPPLSPLTKKLVELLPQMPQLPGNIPALIHLLRYGVTPTEELIRALALYYQEPKQLAGDLEALHGQLQAWEAPPAWEPLKERLALLCRQFNLPMGEASSEEQLPPEEALNKLVRAFQEGRVSRKGDLVPQEGAEEKAPSSPPEVGKGGRALNEPVQAKGREFGPLIKKLLSQRDSLPQGLVSSLERVAVHFEAGGLLREIPWEEGIPILFWQFPFGAEPGQHGVRIMVLRDRGGEGAVKRTLTFSFQMEHLGLLTITLMVVPGAANCWVKASSREVLAYLRGYARDFTGILAQYGLDLTSLQFQLEEGPRALPQGPIDLRG
ncbi:MAG: hypothetical protein ACOYD6_03915 [Limnochordia bacterium]